MSDAFARKRLGGSIERRIESYQPRVAEINALEKQHEVLSDAALRARSEDFKKQLADSKPLDARRDERDKQNLATGVRVRSKSASLAARPPAKGSEG
jgi:uncharacterized protein (DUF2345 family)